MKELSLREMHNIEAKGAAEIADGFCAGIGIAAIFTGVGTGVGVACAAWGAYRLFM